MFLFIFWKKLMIPKKHFEINWPLAEWKMVRPKLRKKWFNGASLAWTHHYNLPLSRIFREKYVQSDNNKKISQFEMFIWPYAQQLFTKLFLKDATFLHIVAVMSTLPNVKHDETLSEEALLFTFPCNFKRSLCKTY